MQTVTLLLDKELPDFTERKIEGNLRYLGRIVSLEDDVVELPDGRISAREVVRHPGAAVVLPVLDNNRIVMVWQYRYPIGAHSLELPAGKIDKGEEPAETARRELIEETGYEAEDWEPAFTMHSSVGFCDERLVLFIARGLKAKGREPVEGEFVHTVEVDIENAINMIKDGKITDSKTIAGLLWVRGNS